MRTEIESIALVEINLLPPHCKVHHTTVQLAHAKFEGKESLELHFRTAQQSIILRYSGNIWLNKYSNQS